MKENLKGCEKLCQFCSRCCVQDQQRKPKLKVLSRVLLSGLGLGFQTNSKAHMLLLLLFWRHHFRKLLWCSTILDGSGWHLWSNEDRVPPGGGSLSLHLSPLPRAFKSMPLLLKNKHICVNNKLERHMSLCVALSHRMFTNMSGIFSASATLALFLIWN